MLIFLVVSVSHGIVGMEDKENDSKKLPSALFQFFKVPEDLPSELYPLINVCDIREQHLWQENEWFYKSTRPDLFVYNKESGKVFFNGATGILAVARQDNVDFFDVAKQLKISLLNTREKFIYSGCFNLQGTHMALGFKSSVWVYNLEDSDQITSFGHSGSNRVVCFNNAGNCVAAASKEWVTIVDIDFIKEIFRCNIPKATSLCFSADDKNLVVGIQNEEISRFDKDYSKAYIFDIETNRHLKKTNGSWVSSLANSNTYAMGSPYTSCVFNKEKKKKSARVRYSDQAYSFCSAHSGDYIARGTSRGVAIVDTHKAINRNFFTLWRPVLSVTFDESGNYLAASSTGLACLFERCRECSLRQLMLLKIINLWLRVCKHSKKNDTVNNCFFYIARLFSSDTSDVQSLQDEMENSFKVFPPGIQACIQEMIGKNIQRYGKL